MPVRTSGSLAKPFREAPHAPGWIVNVHWKNRDECEGSTTLSGRWGTEDDNSFTQQTTGGGGGGRAYWRVEWNAFFAGAWNNTAACHVTYAIDSTATIAGSSETENFTDSGLLLPGQSFIVGIIRGGWRDIYLAELPSLDREFTYGFGEYRLLDVRLITTTFDP